MRASNSSAESTSVADRLREWIALARLSLRDARQRHDFNDLEASYAEHDAYARRYLGRPLTACRVIEIGYGARPNRLLWFQGNGVDIHGIDLDQPMLHGSLREFWGVYRRNGWARAIKTVGRWFVNERRYRRELLECLSRQRGTRVQVEPARMAVGDATRQEFWQAHHGADYVFSEDVFEHIPEPGLEPLISAMAANMSPTGIAFVKPNIFTGIIGGHHVEWYPHTFNQPVQRRTEPWEHLRQDRHPADTFLNRVPRSRYRELFARYFEILEEVVVEPGLGRQFMTPELRQELSGYPDEELFSNAVKFILRPLPHPDVQTRR